MSSTPLYTLVGTARARVDDVRLVRGGQPQRLTNDQVERLKQAGVQVRKYPKAAKATTTTDGQEA